MFKSTTLPLVILCATAGGALAMSEGFAAIDTSGDGAIGLEELQAVYPDMTGDAFLTMDRNGDGVLDADEVTAAEASGLLPAQEG